MVTVVGILLTSLLAHAADVRCDDLDRGQHVCITTSAAGTMYSVTTLGGDSYSRREISRQEYTRLIKEFAAREAAMELEAACYGDYKATHLACHANAQAMADWNKQQAADMACLPHYVINADGIPVKVGGCTK